MVISNWPMWVVGLTLFVDGMDQYIVRGSSDQIKAAFGVGDTAIGLLFSAFILVNGIVTLPAGYLADRWNRTRAMAVTIVRGRSSAPWAAWCPRRPSACWW